MQTSGGDLGWSPPAGSWTTALDSDAWSRPHLSPADFTFGPSPDQVVRNGDRRWHPQVRMVAPQRGEDLSTGEPPDVCHLFVVDVDVSRQGAGVTANHQ